MKILVADDERAILLLVKVMGEREGHEVDTAVTVDEAAVMSARTKYDAAAIDLCLPTPGQGMKLVRKLLNEGVPRVVIITGGDIEVETADALKELSVQVVMKPFMVPELLRALGVRMAKS